MPFRETGRMEERIRMFLEYDSGNWSVSELCRRYGVCRDTFYEWRKRKANGEAEWFRDRSHAPLQCSQATDAAIAAKVIAARRRFPYLGPRKILAVLDREAPEVDWPAASTIGEILKREGLVTAVKRRRRPPMTSGARTSRAGSEPAISNVSIP
jgi:transposase-like protein